VYKTVNNMVALPDILKLCTRQPITGGTSACYNAQKTKPAISTCSCLHGRMGSSSDCNTVSC